MANRIGGALALVMSAGARVAGIAIYYLLRAIYRPRERAIALGSLAAIIAIVALVAVLR